MPRPRTHDEALRVRLLDRAGELLSEEGPTALSLRRLAADVRTSTTAVYSLFGSKHELVSALHLEGFRRFKARMAAVAPTGDLVEDAVRLGLAYRESALRDPQMYSIMFTKAVPGFEPTNEAKDLARSTLAPLQEVIQAGIEAGLLVDAAPEVITISAWGLVHGLVSLELNGNVPAEFDIGATYERALRAAIAGWMR